MPSAVRIKALREWYSRLHPIRVDLVGDYAGEEPFILEGDSLLRRVFSDKRIDFHSGFQLLHAVYVVESFLQQLKSRRCRFSVVFFDINRNTCIPWAEAARENAWKYLFARSAIVEHLKCINVDEGLIYNFESLGHPDFRQFLDATRPYFIMCHDGAEIPVAAEGQKDWEKEVQSEKADGGGEADNNGDGDGDGDGDNGGDDEYSDEDEEPYDADYVPGGVEAWLEQEILLKQRIQEWMSLGFNVTLINELEFRDSKIFSYVVERNSYNLKIVKPRELRSTVPPGPEFVQEPDWDSFRSARERLTVATVAHALRLDEGQYEASASLFLLHTALLSHLTLSERFSPPFAPDQVASGATIPLQKFLQRVTTLSGHLLKLNAVSFEGAVNDLGDYIDGRLLLRLLLAPFNVPEEVKQGFSNLSEQVEELCGTRLELPVLTGMVEIPVIKDKVGEFSIMPFNNPVFDPYLKEIQLPVDVAAEESGDALDESGRPYIEKSHWHNPRNPLVTARIRAQRVAPKAPPKVRGAVAPPGGKGQQLDKAQKRVAGKQRKWEQIYLNQMYAYASSLTDSIDGTLSPKLVTVEERSKKPGPAGGKKPAAKEEKIVKHRGAGGQKKDSPASSSKGKPGGKLSAAEIISQNNATKKAGREAKLQDSWKTIWEELKDNKDDEEAISRLDAWLAASQKANAASVAENKEWPFIEGEARLYKIQILQRIWTGFCKRKEKNLGYPVTAILFNEARLLLSSGGMTRKFHQILTNLFEGLGIRMPPTKPVDSLPDRKHYFGKGWDGRVESVDLRLGLTSEEFQLLHCGPWMDRNMDSSSDTRVPFKPDGWQRRVLDELDEENSLFVVAPTSAGKTFIAFYAMEKVLKEGDEGVLVYVAPTKALVNQIAAEVISRYKKNYRYAGKTVWAIHTRDYRMNDANECQILITVPHILQIMLLSPTNARTWTPRVKRIIFDEVHSIGHSEDGVVWEQLLLLAPCPIIALSATVGNPEEFGSWLTSTQKSLGVKLTTILHPHRYSDLRKFRYTPKRRVNTFEGLPQKVSKFNQLEFGDCMKVIHPVAALVDTKQGMPDDMSLESRDCLQLYWAMSKAQTAECPLPEDLDFRKVFGVDGKAVTKADVVIWEVELKRTLQAWMNDAEPVFRKVAQLLASGGAEGKSLSSTTGDPKVETQKEDVNTRASTPPSGSFMAYLEETTLPLLRTLHESNALPAILFSYDRGLCEFLCSMLYSQLSDAEKEWRKNSPKWQKTIRDWEKYKADRSAGSKKAKIILPPGSTKADLVRELADHDSSFWASFDPDYPSPEFSFADIKKHARSDLRTDIENLIRWGIPPTLVYAFRRGIGVHHSGLNRKYRQAVEMLFRKGYLRVVIATGTLSLGINMPTRSCVFVGESVFLNSLNFRQAAGRAGRRGFDNLGNVVFHAISPTKADRVMSSKLPSLIGHFPISTSLVLRLFILLHNSNEAAHAKHTINTLLTQSKLVIGGDEFKEQVLHHLRFSVEYLRRQKLIGATGRPLNLAGLVSHLYYVEESSFALHVLLCSGYMEDLCKNITTNPESTCLELMLVLANIFGRRQRYFSRLKPLPPLPPAALEVLTAQNNETLRTYMTYVETFVQTYCKKPDNTLPFSNLQYGGPGISAATETTTKIKSRSAFVALSGHGDNFSSVEDLTSSVRRGVFIDGSSVPHLPVNKEAINGYLYYFYIHGDTAKLEREHNVRRGVVWFVLKDFSLILAAIESGLTCFIRDGEGAYFDFKDEGDDVDGDVHDGEDGKGEGESSDGGSGVDSEASEPKRFSNVLKAVKITRKRFEDKFRKMWA